MLKVPTGGPDKRNGNFRWIILFIMYAKEQGINESAADVWHARIVKAYPCR